MSDLLVEQWSKSNAIAVYNVMHSVFDFLPTGNQSSRLIHTESTGFPSQVIAHWGPDLHYLNVRAC